MTTKREIRCKLPGFSRSEILASDENQRLTLEYVIKGFMDELIFTHNFWITNKNTGETKVYSTLQEAYEAW